MKRTEMQDFVLSAEIGEAVAKAPVIRLSKTETEQIKQRLNERERMLLRSAPHLAYDFELFCTLKKFCDTLNLFSRADDAFLTALFRNAKKYSVQEFYSNPFLKTITAPTAKVGRFLLTNATYEAGEIFQYAEPDFYTEPLVPKLAFCTGQVRFPAVYEDEMPWMSICPSEVTSIAPCLPQAHGKVLVLGLGLGYYPFMIARKQSVSEITIVELQPEVIRLFTQYLLPQFPHAEKIRLVQADALHYLSHVKDGDFDCCFADVWENQLDGAEFYLQIKPYEQKLPHTQFSYWIEKEIQYYLSDVE